MISKLIPSLAQRILFEFQTSFGSE